ncbi:hypothetical protein [Actinomadura sp. B10D3]|uniref:hypothetical protein n=1 Tax=Actinomadura sp. B10D3 TaxID=3153557 RepID=UPI00325DA6A7
MIKNARKCVVSAVASVGLLAVGVSTASAEPAKKAEVPSVSLTGSARMHYAPSPQDQVHVSFNAHAAYPEWGQDPKPGKAGGVVRISHAFTGHPEVSGWAEVKVDCVLASGAVAVVTGDVVRHSQHFSGWKNKRVGFTVVDAGRTDQLGFTGPVNDLDACFGKAPRQSPAPFMLTQTGGFKLRNHLPPVH